MSLGFRFFKSILSISAFTHVQNDPGIIREKKKKKQVNFIREH